MKKKPDSDSDKPVRLGIQPAALGYLSLLIVTAVVLGFGKLMDWISAWLR